MDENEASEFLKHLVKVAKKNQETVHDTETLRQLIDDNDLVYGVWNDPEATHGVRHRIIKGEGILDVGAHTGISQNVTVTAVACRNIEEVEAMRQTFGDMSKLQ